MAKLMSYGISDSYIRQSILGNLNNILLSMLYEARTQGLEFFIINGHTPAFNDGEPCTHSQEVTVDVFGMEEAEHYSPIETSKWDFSTRKDQYVPDIHWGEPGPKDLTGWNKITKVYPNGYVATWWESTPPIPSSQIKKDLVKDLTDRLNDLSIAFYQTYNTNFFLLIYILDGKLQIDKFDYYPEY